MSELKPCPFCGGEAVVRALTISKSFVVFCEDCPIGFLVPYDSEQEAIDAWNTRAERTCRNVNEGHDFTCSRCGDWTSNPFPEVMPLLKLNFCPNCGAEVVEE